MLITEIKQENKTVQVLFWFLSLCLKNVMNWKLLHLGHENSGKLLQLLINKAHFAVSSRSFTLTQFLFSFLLKISRSSNRILFLLVQVPSVIFNLSLDVPSPKFWILLQAFPVAPLVFISPLSLRKCEPALQGFSAPEP